MERRGARALTLCSHALSFTVQFIQRGQIGLGRCDHDVRVSTYAIDHSATVLKSYGDFTLRFRATRSDRVDRIQQHLSPRLHFGFDGL